MSLENKVGIITGAAIGIGRAIATRFVKEGAIVAIDHVGNGAPANELVSALKTIGGRAVAIAADVSDAKQVAMLFDETINVRTARRSGQQRRHREEDAVRRHARGRAEQSHRNQSHRIARGDGGQITNISSVHEGLALPTNSPNCAAKGGLRMLMRTIAVELAPHNILVNNIAPGAVHTPMDAALKADPKELDTLLDEIALARMGKPDEIAKMCALLASGGALYSTGSLAHGST